MLTCPRIKFEPQSFARAGFHLRPNFFIGAHHPMAHHVNQAADDRYIPERTDRSGRTQQEFSQPLILICHSSPQIAGFRHPHSPDFGCKTSRKLESAQCLSEASTTSFAGKRIPLPDGLRPGVYCTTSETNTNRTPRLSSRGAASSSVAIVAGCG